MEITAHERIRFLYALSVWMLAHIGGGAVALLTGPVQLWLGVSRRAIGVFTVRPYITSID